MGSLMTSWVRLSIDSRRLVARKISESEITPGSSCGAPNGVEFGCDCSAVVAAFAVPVAVVVGAGTRCVRWESTELAGRTEPASRADRPDCTACADCVSRCCSSASVAASAAAEVAAEVAAAILANCSTCCREGFT